MECKCNPMIDHNFSYAWMSLSRATNNMTCYKVLT